ncbi:MAG: 50S ribosomal protein L13 [Methanomicrobiales archaeon]|nr:50S ribosomal protein L13 [Methanomicrobiales archaeon]
MPTVINAENLLLGRLASIVAHRALDGEELAIVNVEKAVISGSRERIFALYNRKHRMGSTEKGPYFPRRPERIAKRTIRGMLPYKRKIGREALARVKTYVGVPEEFAGAEMETLPEAHMNRLRSPRFVTLGAVSEHLGSKF